MDCLDYHSDDSDVIEDVSEDGSIPVQGQLDRSPAAKVLADIAYIAQLVEMENRYMDEELRAAKVSAVDPPKQVADHCKDQSDSDETSESEVSESMDAVEDLESLCEEDEHDEEVPSAGPPRTKNELLRESPETIDQEVLPSDEEIIPVGKVLYCISNEGVLVVQSDATSQPLNENSILCTKSRLVVGRVSEVFGPITAPYYVIRSQFLLSKSDESIGIKAESVRGSDLDSNTATKQLAQFDSETLSPGSIMFCAKRQSSFVVPTQLLKQCVKGSDASNIYDEEPADDEIEYSDDEQEMLAKQQKKKRKDRSNTHATEMGMRSVGNERKENKSYQGKHSEQSRNYHRNSHLNIQQRSTTNSQYNSVANAGGVDLLGIQPFSYGLQTTTMMAPVVHNAVQPFQRPPIPKGPPPVPYGQPPISSYPLVPSTPSVPWQGFAGNHNHLNGNSSASVPNNLPQYVYKPIQFPFSETSNNHNK